MDKLLDTLNQYLQAASGTLAKYGPGVWNSTLSLMRIDGIFNVAVLLFWSVVISVVAVKVLPFAYRKIAEDEDHAGYMATAVIGTIGCIIGSIIVLIGWSTSLIYWLEVFNPQSAALYQLAAKAGLIQ